MKNCRREMLPLGFNCNNSTCGKLVAHHKKTFGEKQSYEKAVGITMGEGNEAFCCRRSHSGYAGEAG